MQVMVPHGGQVWYGTTEVLEDLSVTANALGIPDSCIAAITTNLNLIARYPPVDWEPARTQLADFIGVTRVPGMDVSQLLVGNGASELIDVAVRYVARSGARAFGLGPASIQYMEYEQSARRAGLVKADRGVVADLHMIVNPNNPLGSFMDGGEIVSYLRSECRPGSYVVIDESMLPWKGPDWRDQSIVQSIPRVRRELDLKVLVIHSWTKLWCCCGLRVGSLLAPDPLVAAEISRLLVPWNVNTLAIAFVCTAVTDTEYLERTWILTPKWRAQLRAALEKANWKVLGTEWLPWLWVDVGSQEGARRLILAAAACGLPVRSGEAGYRQPTHVRIRVCPPEIQEMLLTSLRTARLLS